MENNEQPAPTALSNETNQPPSPASSQYEQSEQHGACACCGWALLLPVAKPLAQMPCCFIVVSLVAVAIIISTSLAANSIEIEPNFDSFIKSDVKSSMMQDAFDKALSDRVADGRRLQEEDESGKKQPLDLWIIYELHGNHNLTGGILNEAALRAIANLERDLRDRKGWQSMCKQARSDTVSLCMPGISFANYGLATQEIPGGQVVPTRLKLDGRAWGELPLALALHLAKSHDLNHLFFNDGFKIDSQNPYTTQLRSLFRFKVEKDVTGQWKDFMRDDVMPRLSKGFCADEKLREQCLEQERKGGPYLKAFYTGSYVEDVEVVDALMGDMRLAGLSFAFVVMYLIFHTRSVFQSVLGLAAAIIAVPLSYAIVAMLGNTTVSFASFLAVFLTIGFGCDTVLIYTDYWRDSALQLDVPGYDSRLAWTLWHGGMASIATTGTTALSFFANLASVIRALRQFGFFMGLCVMLAWFLITIIYVPFCVVDERMFRRCRLIARSTKQKQPGYMSGRQVLFSRWGRHLHRYRCVYALLPVLLLIVGFLVAVASVRMSLHAPSLFPDEHNRNRVDAALEPFSDINNAISRGKDSVATFVDVCPVDAPTPLDSPFACSMWWCDAELMNTENFCDCMRLPRNDCRQLDVAGRETVRVMVDGDLLDTVSIEAIASYANASASEVGMLFPSDGMWQAHYETVGTTLMQEWVTGIAHNQRTKEFQLELESKLSNDHSTGCGHFSLCFCGSAKCKKSGMRNWTETTVNLKAIGTTVSGATQPSNRRLIEEQEQEQEVFEVHGLPVARRLAVSQVSGYVAQTISDAKATKVRVTWGLTVDTSIDVLWENTDKDKWGFDPRFNLKDPWTQRYIYQFCTEIPPELNVYQSWCWVADFKDCVESSPETKFPLLPHRFNEYAQRCCSGDPGEQGEQGDLANCKGQLQNSARYLWVRDGEIKALYATFMLNVPKDGADVNKVLNLKEKWDIHVDNYNQKSDTGGALHVSSLWVYAESKIAMVASLLVTMVILLSLAFSGMMIFTFSLVLSLWVVVATVGVLFGLVFFIVTIMQWSIGMIEGISIIYFIGYALTYSLHVAHVYAGDIEKEPDPRKDDYVLDASHRLRFKRGMYTLKSIGGATLGSGITTAGASFFLTFCTLTLFQRLGAMCFIVTVVSVLVALGPLPGGLFTCGPRNPGHCRKVQEGRRAYQTQKSLRNVQNNQVSDQDLTASAPADDFQ